jgi:hypothetical protein
MKHRPLLALALLAGACSSDAAPWSPYMGATPISSDSLTVQRLRGQAPAFEPLLPEPGNVWPDPAPSTARR